MNESSPAHDFLTLYLHHVGKSEIPRRFHLWTAVSVIAACVGGRVSVRVNLATTICPNLYVFLIGPSGGGKGQAIGTGIKLIIDAKEKLAEDGYDRDELQRKCANIYAGMATKQAFIDFLALNGSMRKGVTMVEDPEIYFVTEELGMALDNEKMAQGLITFMTGCYTRPPFPITEGTRSRGYIQLHSPTYNWLAGTTEEWWVKFVPKDAIESGFGARILSVQDTRNYSERCPQVLLPEDYDEIRAGLIERAKALLFVTGEFELTPEAIAIHDEWYMSRPVPDDKLLLPSYNRGDEMIYRLSLLLALAEWPGEFNNEGEAKLDRKIHSKHVLEAIDLFDDTMYDTGRMVSLASATPHSAEVNVVREIIEGMQRIDRSTLTKRATKRGLNKERLDRALATLFDETVIKQDIETNGPYTKRWYIWTG